MQWRMVTLLAITLILGGCKTDNGFDTYYEFMFMDNVSAVVVGDTVHVVIYEVAVNTRYLTTIPFEVTDNAALGDTIQLRLSVLYGGYSPTTSPNKAVHVGGDSVLLRYNRAASPGGFAKLAGTVEVETSPKITYYSIQAVEIAKRPGRHITFASLNIREWQ